MKRMSVRLIHRVCHLWLLRGRIVIQFTEVPFTDADFDDPNIDPESAVAGALGEHGREMLACTVTECVRRG